MTITPLFRAMNLGEAIFWIAIGLVCAISMVWNKRDRVDSVFAAIYFIIFGISDLVERNTGAWYRPWWLLAWKVCCLVGFLVLLIWYYQRKRVRMAMNIAAGPKA